MKEQIKFMGLICALTALLSACNSDIKNSESVEGTQSTAASDTVTEPQPTYTNGELTQNLAKELNELFDGDTYYFKSTTNFSQDKDSDIDYSFSTYFKDGNDYGVISTTTPVNSDTLEEEETYITSVNGELQSGKKYIKIDNAVYSIDDAKKRIYRWTDNISMFDTMLSPANIFPSGVKYISTSIIEEDGKQLTCEAYSVEDTTYNYYYDGEKLKKYETIYNENQILSSTIEYSKEIDKSLFEFPKDYEIVNVEAGN